MTEPKRKICKACGNEFYATGRRVYCNEIKVKTCPVCGKKFEHVCKEYIPSACSPECTHKLVVMNRDANAQKTAKMCKYCGKPFYPKTPRSVYCDGPHYNTCVICGKEFEVFPKTRDVRSTCSDECKNRLLIQNTDVADRAKKTKEALMRKYGVDNPMHIPGAVEKIKKTCKERYGDEYYVHTQHYKDKLKKTCNEKYGVDHHLSAKSVIDKRTETVRRVYGVDNVFQSEEVKDKIKETLSERYGRGTVNFSQTRVENKDLWDEFKSDPVNFLTSHFSNRPTIHDISDKIGICVTSAYNVLNEHNVEVSKYVKHEYSRMEIEVEGLLRNIDSGIIIVRNTRSVIKPYELDIWLPQYQVGIECNPTSTHNSSMSDPWDNDIKDTNYHKMKTGMCKDKGIFVFHLFSYEWNHKREIMESILMNLIGSVDMERIYARKCDVREVSSKDAMLFLERNHRQGNAGSSVRLGLYHEDELVSLMTFGKTRRNISDRSGCEWELLRFCNNLNTSVPGGASKLFKHFVSDYDPKSIISYADRARTRGKVYEVLGFTHVRDSEPGYVWVDLNTDVAYNRYNTQKHNLKNFLHDDSIDMSKSERQIMIDHGFVQVFDSGVSVWEWRK